MTNKPTLVPLGTLLALIAALAGVGLFVMDCRSYTVENDLFHRYQRLFELKKGLVQIESALIKARLDQSHLGSEQNAEYARSFDEHTATVRTEAKEHFIQIDDPEIDKSLLVMLEALDRYRDAVQRIATLQKEMGLSDDSGYPTNIATLEQRIQDRLQALNQPALERQFADLRLREREFRLVFDRRSGNNLHGQASAMVERIKELPALDPDQMALLRSDMERYRDTIGKQRDRAIDLEIAISQSSLHFERILPYLTIAQRRVDSDLSVLVDRSRKQGSSLLVVAVIVTSAFVLMVVIVLIQMLRENRTGRRLRALAAVMHEVAEGNLARAGEATLPQGDDDVGRMAESLATMAAQIHSQRDIIARERERAEEGESMSRERSRLLARLSHELRTSLSGVLGLIELFEQTELNTEQQSYSNVIRQNSESLMALAHKVDAQAKLDAGMVELARNRFSLSECIDSALALFRPRATDKGMTLDQRMVASVPDRLIGDDARLRKILHHLVASTIKIARSGTISVAVQTISRTDSNVELQFMIQLQGADIPAEDIEKALQPVIQARSAGNKEDGVPTSICAELVEMMGGRIWTKSEKNDDVRVYFTVRLESAETGEQSRQSADNDISPVHPLTTDLAQRIPLRILLVEDTPVNQMLMTRIFQKMGYALDIAKNGREAVERARDASYDLILMDIQMPEMDGWEASSIILQEADHEHRPRIVAVTANASDENRQRCMAVGMDDFVSKPFTLKRMQAVVEQWGQSASA